MWYSLIMNLNNLTHPDKALAVVRDIILAHASAIHGLKRCSSLDELGGGYLHAEWQRSFGVGAQLNVHLMPPTVHTQRADRRKPQSWARISDVHVTVCATQQTVSPAIAIAQATLHRSVAELACLIEAALQDLTVGEPCDEEGRDLEPSA